MSDTENIETEATTEAVPDKPKKSEPKRLKVRVLRAVDGYHHRGAVLDVPNDEYHRGLLRQGNLKAAD